MVDSLLKLKVVEKGTHILPVGEWNNDVPNPAEAVADALVELEFKIGELVKSGGAIQKPSAYHDVKQSVLGLNLALNAASKQNWKLELVQNT
jgi:hypothetical protein